MNRKADTRNQQRAARMYAVIKGDAGRRYGRDLDRWLTYWERYFVNGASVNKGQSTVNRWRLNRLIAILKRSRTFRAMFGEIICHFEFCRRNSLSPWYPLRDTDKPIIA